MDALFEQLSAVADKALDSGKGFDPAQVEGLLALFERKAHVSWAAAESKHVAAASDAEAALGTAERHLNSVMDGAVGEYRGFSHEADALSSAMAAMESAFKATKIRPS